MKRVQLCQKRRSAALAAARGGMAVVLACALSPIAAAPAFADEPASSGQAAQSQSDGSVHMRGIDTLSIGGGAFDLAYVLGLGGDTLYADVSVDGTLKQSALPYTYDRDTDEAGVVSLKAKASYVAAHSGSIGISFYTMAGEQKSDSLLDATVYAVAMRVDGQPLGTVADSLVGIRTCVPADAAAPFEAPRLIVRDGTTYRLASAGATATPQLEDGVLYVDYNLVEGSMGGGSASVAYVDEDGSVLVRDELGTLSGSEELTTDLRDTLEANGKVYVPISKMPTVTLTASSPEAVIHCVQRREASMETKTVSINYVTADGAQLMRDTVEVGVGGYAYAPPKTFSQAKSGAVERYVLTGGYDSRQASYDAEAASALELSFDGAPEITLVYEPEAAGLTYTVNFALVSPTDAGGFSVLVDSSQTASVTEADAATISAPDTIERDGATYARVGDSDLRYDWSDFKAGRLLSDTVYYTRSDMQPANPYDVTVRYVDVISGNEIGGEVLSCGASDMLSIEGPDRIEADGATYERLTGQDAAITHRYYAPYRTYTIYYAEPGSVSEGDITVVRTDVIDGGVRFYEVDGGGNVTSAATADAGGLSAATPYATVVSSSNSSGVAESSEVLTPEGESAYEERIADDQTPLAAAADVEQSSSALPSGLITGVLAAAVAACAAAFAVVRTRSKKRRNANDAKEA